MKSGHLGLFGLAPLLDMSNPCKIKYDVLVAPLLIHGATTCICH